MSARTKLIALALLSLGAVSIANGCGKDADTPTAPYAYGTLAVDIRQSVVVKLSHPGTASASGALDGVDVELTFAAGDWPLFDASQPLSARGRIEAFEEAAMTMITARYALPARKGSPCGDQPISASLALTRRGKNARVGGGLTFYCGQGVYAGVPKAILRFSGDLPLGTP
jgi:hypothetical protein